MPFAGHDAHRDRLVRTEHGASSAGADALSHLHLILEARSHAPEPSVPAIVQPLRRAMEKLTGASSMIAPRLKMLDSDAQEAGLLEGHVRSLFDGKSRLEILEAGCGWSWPLKLDGIQYRLTGVDIDDKALAKRVNEVKDLDEAIVADLRYLELGGRKFDVIYNAFVLEHVESAGLVLENFTRWLKPGGLLILMIPDRDSAYGFVTNITPFWFHVAFYKYIVGRKDAGKPGFGPYPTYYDGVVSRSGVRDFCKSGSITLTEEYGRCSYQGRDLRSRVIRLLAITVSALSMGRLPWKHNNLTYVLRKE
jgi:SAM-dependent methyltransferase